MSLPDDYLTYPKRRHGQDMDRYDWRLAQDRVPLVWPGGKALAVLPVIPVEWHPLNPSGKPFKHPGAMQTPYPDLRHFTTRDYGARVGVFRLLDALKASGLKATFPISAALLTRCRPLVDAILEDGHEVAAAGLHTDAIHWGGIEPDTERRYVEQTRSAFDAIGLFPTTWISPARQESRDTPDLLTEFGFTVCLDWESDSVPFGLRTAHGPLTALPVHNELDDTKLLITNKQADGAWAKQILAAADFLIDEAPMRGGQVLAFTCTPYILGQPFRARMVRETFAALAANTRIWTGTARDICKAAG
jgi:hypothetical protein